MSKEYIPYRDQFMRQTEILVHTIQREFGLPVSAIIIPTTGNGVFLSQSSTKGKYGVSVGKHDEILENFSALWPEGLEWPSDIPRPPKALALFDQLSQEARDSFAARIEKAKAKKEMENRDV